MSLDITAILDGWPYEPGQASARKIVGDDGREKIQLRLDLGLLQMESVGRPDGEQPHGHESLLHYHEHLLECHVQTHGSAEGFSLDEQACEHLRAEAMMYYHRYLAEFVLEDYDAVERDTMRNLRLMEFCKTHAADRADQYFLEQYRPYVMMMLTRARGQRALRDSRPKAGLAIVKRGIDELRVFFHQYDQDEVFESSGEVAILRALAKELESRVPTDPVTQLNEQLAQAVEEERYEEAAALRDKLQRVQNPNRPARSDDAGNQ